MSSFSGVMVSSTTTFRNPNGPEYEWCHLTHRNPANPLRVIVAEAIYLITIPIAIVEMAMALIAKAFTSCLDDMHEHTHQDMTKWLGSASFALVWAIADSVINLIANDMIEREHVALAAAKNFQLLSLPQEAYQLSI